MEVEAPVIGIDRPKVDALTGLRILAAFWVVIEHFNKPIYALLPSAKHASRLIDDGYLGVEVFFVLSGFIISYQYAERLTPITSDAFRRYLQLRFARIYPVHFVALGIVAALYAASRIAHVSLSFAGNYTPLTFFSNLTMWQAIPPGVPWNGPSWSITMEGLAYLAFPLVAPVLVGIARRGVAVAGAASGVTLTCIGMLLLGRTRGYSSIGLPEILLRIAGEFLAGCFLWALWRLSACSRRWDLVAVASLLAGAGIVAAIPEGRAANFWVLPFIALFVYACAAATGPVAAMLSTRLFQWGGRVSYSVYMTHFIVLMVVGKILRWTDYASDGLAVRIGVLTCYFAAVAISATAMYYVVEEPARRWLRPREAHLRQLALPAQPSPGFSSPA